MAIELGKGTAIKVMDRSIMCDADVRTMMIETAKKNKIPYQLEIMTDGVIFRDSKVNEDGSIEEIPGTEKKYPCTSVIVSISQGAQDQILSRTKGIDTNKKGLLVTNEYGETTREGIFASGDIVKGAKTVVEAVKYSKLVADAMDEYMQGANK